MSSSEKMGKTPAKRVLLLPNAAAGTGAGGASLFRIVEALTECGCETTVSPIVPEKGLTAEDMIRTAGDRFDAIVVCGGDGTLSHAVNTIMETGCGLPVGYIPLGTVNDFAQSLYGQSLAIEDIAALIGRGETRVCDIGRFNERYFTYVAAFGAFTQVSYTTPRQMKNAIGHAAYVLNLLVSIPESLSYRIGATIRHDGGEEGGEYLVGIFSNTVSVGGVKASYFHRSELNDGLFEVSLVQAPQNLIELNEIAASVAAGDMNNRYIRTFQTRRLTISCEAPAAWTLDGEEGGLHREASISIVPKALRFFAPSGI